MSPELASTTALFSLSPTPRTDCPIDGHRTAHRQASTSRMKQQARFGRDCYLEEQALPETSAPAPEPGAREVGAPITAARDH